MRTCRSSRLLGRILASRIPGFEEAIPRVHMSEELSTEAALLVEVAVHDRIVSVNGCAGSSELILDRPTGTRGPTTMHRGFFVTGA